jgi:hypothetical protein
MYSTAIRLIAVIAALVTLILMTYMARPWGDTYAYQTLSGYAGLLAIAVWATLPYLVLFIMARSAVHFKTKTILVLIGALIISVGGLAAYADVIWLRPDPQGGLAFLAVPFYQWIILGLLAGLQLLVKKSAVA